MFAFAGTAFTLSSTRATVDPDIRPGPGPSHQVAGVIQGDGDITVDNCIAGTLWCRIVHDGNERWVYSEYLTAEFEGERVVIWQQREAVGVPVYLGGEFVIAAGVADNVEQRTFPDYENRDVDLNQVPALVEPDTRRIVYVLR